jgi:hypothetical protein
MIDCYRVFEECPISMMRSIAVLIPWVVSSARLPEFAIHTADTLLLVQISTPYSAELDDTYHTNEISGRHTPMNLLLC